MNPRNINCEDYRNHVFDLAQFIYESYYNISSAKNAQGNTITAWENLNKENTEIWFNVAQAVIYRMID